MIKNPQEVKRLAGLVADWMRVATNQMPQLADFLHFDLVVAAWEQGEDMIMRDAPHAVMARAPADDFVAPIDAPIALTYLEVAAYGLGLGACWAGYFQLAASSPAMIEALQLPEGHRCLGDMMIGYPKHRFARIPLKKAPTITWH